MKPPLSVLIRTKDFDALARVIEGRWGIAPTAESLRWLHRIAFERPRRSVGGTAGDPWSESTWLMWIKNRLDDLASDPDCVDDPAYRYGPAFDVEKDPASADAWRSFLERYSEELLADEDLELWAPIPVEAREAGWMGFAPADESMIRAAEDRLGRRLPPALRGFYSASNGWRATGRTIYDILPVEAVGWLAEREPSLYAMAREVEAEEGPFRDDPGDARLSEYREEQGTRVKRGLAISSRGNNGVIWLLDPGPGPHPGEWPAGIREEDGMIWSAANFAELMADELRDLHGESRPG